MNDELKSLLLAIATVAFIGLVFALVGRGLSIKSCRDMGAMMEMETQYTMSTGCMVKTPHGWRDINVFRQVEE